MSFKLYGFKDCDTTKGVLAVAKLFDFKLELVPLTCESCQSAENKALSPMKVYPVLLAECGKTIFGMHAICKFIVKASAKCDSCDDKCKILCCLQKGQWMDYAATELYPLARKLVLPYLKLSCFCSKGEQCALNQLKEKFTLLNDYLATRTYLSDERVRVCDFVVAANIYSLFTLVLAPEFVKPYPHLVRWFLTIANQPAFKEAFGETVLLKAAPVKPCDCGKSIAEAQLEKFQPVLAKFPFTCEFCKAKDVLTRELDAWLIPVYAQKVCDPAIIKSAKSAVRATLVDLNKYLATRTFISSERLARPDIVLASLLCPLYQDVMEPGFIKQFVHLNRWFNTVINQPAVKEVVGDFVFCTKEKKAPEPPKEKKAPQPKKEEKKKEEKKKDENAEEEAPRKPKFPMDLLPPSPMDLDAWKRCYSNEDTRSVALPYFWKNYDREGYSLWFCKYKYEVEYKQVFQVANLVGGMLQRMEHLHKYGFGSMLIFGNEFPFEIAGVWMFRGHNFNDVMGQVDDAELYDWRELNIDNADDRKLIEDYFAWDGELGGQKKPVNQGF